MTRIAPFRHIPAPQLSQLEYQMQAYYAAVPDYPAFHAPSDHPQEWRHLLAEVRRRKGSSQEPVAILDSGLAALDFPAGCGICWAPIPRLRCPSPVRT